MPKEKFKKDGDKVIGTIETKRELTFDQVKRSYLRAKKRVETFTDEMNEAKALLKKYWPKEKVE